MKRVVVIGGGTGTFTTLTGLRHYKELDLTAIVAMTDDGGSTGQLRDEYGVLPPGDLRQCLVALSEAPTVLRKLFLFRYDRGSFKGHNFGNLFLSTLEQVTGSLDEALDLVKEVLQIRGNVIPVTLTNARLIAELKNGKVLKGENTIGTYQLVSKFGIRRVYLTPRTVPNPKALGAIAAADLIVVGPGNFYASLVPNFLVSGIASAVRRAKAKKVLVTNIMNKHGQTDDFTPETYLTTIERLAGGKIFDAVLTNNQRPSATLLRRYSDEGEPVPMSPSADGRLVIKKNLLAPGIYKTSRVDRSRRTLIRHDPAKLASALYALL